ncbi:MAG: MipA/OmpV family protein [Pseudomonadota bacterium]
MTSSLHAPSSLALGLALATCPASLLAQEIAPQPVPETPALSGDTGEKLDAVVFSLAAMEVGSLEVSAETALASEGAENAEGAQDEAAEKKSRSWPKVQMPKIVFDETWLSVGIGAGMVPSYSGSDDYVLFPLPLIVGRVGGVGIRPNGPGIRLDLLSPEPALGPNQKTTFNFGPAIRFRNDRAQRIEDEVVELAEDLDVALEVGAAGGVTFPGVFNPLDSLTFNAQVRWDVLGAHDGMLVEPTIGYARPFGRGVLFQANIGAQFVDDNFADYYFTVTPEQSAATGLPEFTADGGLNNVSASAIVNVDLDGNALNGGLSVYTIVSYTRLVGDGADTPFTDIRGDANQFVGGVGIAYTF